ncbi:cholinesterase-like [Amblyomma americanum]
MMAGRILSVACLFSLAFLVISVSSASVPNNEEAPVINAAVGKLRGSKRVVADDKTVYAFTGVPYAKPPVGQLRYRKPEPETPWGDNERDATKTPPSCMQVAAFAPRNLLWVPFGLPTSEDCLYLNVWTPTLNASAALPVMAWLHGGGFQVGSAAMPVDDGGNLAALGNVVVVTIAYRLQSFGFLYDGTDAAPGNQGLHDQALALRWIQDNINAFGGNPEEVTLFGWSAGGISTGFHLLSPGSKALFKRAIIQSAGVTKKGRAKDKFEMLKYSRSFARRFGCYNDSSDANIVPCLQNINETLLSIVEQTFVYLEYGKFEPIFGDSFLPIEPRSAEFSGDKDVMIGQTANEGTNAIYTRTRESFSEILAPRKINKAEMLHYLGRLYANLTLPQLMKLHELYMSEIGDFDYDALRQALAETKGDSHVTCGSVNAACKLANATAMAESGKKVHFYEMNYVSPCTKRQAWFGMTHGDDIPLVFGRAFDKEGGCAADSSYSRKIMDIWSSFAKGRTPTAPEGNEWPKFTSDSQSILKLTATGSEVSRFNRNERCKALKELNLY